MEKIQVKSWFSGKVIFEAEAESFKKVVEAAVRSKADLSGADLRSADLHGADLSCADLSRSDLSRAYLRGADLRGADLSSADLREANLRGADLRRADLRRADLSGADLIIADLSGADLSFAYLRGAYLKRADLKRADLRGAHLNWSSHELMSAVLLQKSEGDIERIKVAGAILCLSDWCWDDFFKLRSEPQFSWAIDTLAGYVVDGDEAPEELVNWKNRSSAASGEGGLS